MVMMKMMVVSEKVPLNDLDTSSLRSDDSVLPGGHYFLSVQAYYRRSSPEGKMKSPRLTSRSLHCLVYCSRQKFPHGNSIDEEIARIIDASVINNGKAEITGLLLVHAGWFVQALEGPADQVMTTYRRILNDKRHSDSQVISSGPIVKRNFGNWNMCAKRFNKANDAILDTLSQRDAFNPSKLRGPAALRLLASVGEIQARILRQSQAQVI